MNYFKCKKQERGACQRLVKKEKEKGKHFSRRQSQQYQRRQKKLEQKPDTASIEPWSTWWKRQRAQQRKECDRKIWWKSRPWAWSSLADKIMFTYNYVPDITVSPRRNAIRMLLEQPRYLVTQKPRQSSFHNLCSASTTIPPTLHSLLGLGLIFCPTPTTTTPLDQVELERFTKDYRRRILFANGPALESDSILYVKNTHWVPSIPESTTLHTHASKSIA